MTLNTQQVTDLLTRNGALASAVQEFNLANYFATYTQANGGAFDIDFLSWLLQYAPSSPIPSYGVEINDPVYGLVDVFPNVSGTLLFNTVSTSNPAAQKIDTGGTAPIGLPSLPQIGSVLQLGAVAVIVFFVYKLAK